MEQKLLQLRLASLRGKRRWRGKHDVVVIVAKSKFLGVGLHEGIPKVGVGIRAGSGWGSRSGSGQSGVIGESAATEEIIGKGMTERDAGRECERGRGREQWSWLEERKRQGVGGWGGRD